LKHISSKVENHKKLTKEEMIKNHQTSKQMPVSQTAEKAIFVQNEEVIKCTAQ